MEIIEFFSAGQKDLWLDKLGECDWRNGRYLCELLREGRLCEKTGPDPKVLLLTENGELLSFCVFSAKKYDIESDLTPWIGFVYTFPAYRGRRLAGTLLAHAEALAGEMGFGQVYISTNHEGLYERYGYRYVGDLPDWRDQTQRIYRKKTAAGEGGSDDGE